MKIQINKEQIPKEVAFGEGTFLVASREIEQIYSNLSNLFPICLICTDLYDFCPLGHSFFSHHIATYREHHFQSYLENFYELDINFNHKIDENYKFHLLFVHL